MWPHKSKYRRAFYVSKPKQRGPKPKPNMESLRITKKHKKHLNNPFPSTPTPIAFLAGTLTFNPQTLPPHQIYSIGHDFQLSWQSKDGGSLSISHKSQPTRPIWSTIPGQAFVSAAMAETEVEESRGSFFIRDRDVRLVCDHQTIDHIRVLIDQSDCDVDTIDHDFSSGYGELYQEIGIKDKNFPVLVITGRIFCFGRGKRRSENGVLENPDFSQSTYAKYWVLFYQKNSDQIGFQVKIGKPNFDMYQRTTSPKLSYTFPGFSKRIGRLRIRPLGWCCNSRKRRSFSPAASTNEEHLMKDSECANFNRVCLTYSSEKNERFYGFGEQFSHMNFKGKRVPIFVQEQGIGRGDQPITFAANLVSYRAGGDWSTTYAPSPFYVTSKMKSLYLEGYKYSVFDLTRHDRVQIQTHGDTVQGRILNGSSPLEFIEHFTEAIGRPPELPEWIISGAVVGMQGGTDFVREIWAKLQRYEVPISAFWLQDWVGQRKTVIGSQLWWNWEVDTARYSGWKHLIRDLSACNIKVMTYCNPYLAPMDEKANKRRHLFEEAKKLGILVKDSEGNPYMVPNTAFDVGMLDLTHPHTAGWFKQVLQEMVDEGVSGWMADFGEGLPVDASLYSGEDPISAHNRYPELWAKLNREFVEECKSKTVAEENNTQDALVFFMRAGFTNSPKWAMLFWEGDQMVSWQANDGIKSAVVGLLSSGLSGYAFNHSDIGGYCAVNVPFLKYQRSEELLLRWMELNAFTTVYRTHEGNKPSFNSQFYSNDKTLSQFSRFAKVYKAWKFYRIQLVKEASKRGWPVCRHLFLHYPDDERVQSLRYEQFLVGKEILVVPVLDKGKRKVKVYFPIGEMSSWKHIWTGNVYSKQGCEVWVEAPIGYPAVFVKAGSVIGETFLTFLREYNVL